MIRFLLSVTNILGLLACWIGVISHGYWVILYSTEYFKGNKPLDWGFSFLFSLELIVAGGVAVVLALFIAYASSTELPELLRRRPVSKFFFLGVLLFLLSLLIQFFINPHLFK